MSRYVVFIILFIVVNSFVVLEEESLVFIASFLWIDAAGSVIREALTSELEGKGDKIKEVFEWYLTAQKNLEEVLITKHKLREDLVKGLVGIYSLYLERLLDSIVKSYQEDYTTLLSQERKNDIVERGLLLVNDLARKEIQVSLSSQGLKESNWVGQLVKEV
jgi:hypothetical protein